MALFNVNITITPPAGGSVKDNLVSGQAEEGSTVNLFAGVNSGYRFVDWKEGVTVVSTSRAYSFTMPSSDVNLEVTFALIPIPDVDQQKSIYDTSCPKFFFIKNMTDRWFAGDVFDVTVYDYTELVEPINFDSGKFKLERDRETHGFNYEFSVDNLGYEIGTAGYDLLKSEFALTGTDTDIKFVYGFGDVDAFTLFYMGRVDFNEYREVSDGEIIEFNARELDFDNILQASYDVPQIVDTPDELLLHSKVIPKQIEYRVVDDTPTESGANAFFETPILNPILAQEVYFQDRAIINFQQADNPYQKAYMFVNSGRQGNDTLNDFYTYDFFVNTNKDFTVYQDERCIGRATEAGIYNLTIKGTYAINFFNGGAFSAPYPLQLVVATTESDGETIITENIYEADDVQTVSSPLASADVFISFNREVQVDLDFDQCLYVYYLIDTTEPRFPALLTNGNAAILRIRSLPFFLAGDGESFSPPSITVNAETFTTTSKAKASKTFDVLNSVLKSSAERTDNILVSDFFDTNGCGEKLFLTNGFNIRGGQANLGVDQESLKLKVSPKSLFTMLSDIFCLGWGVEYDLLKKEVVRVEPVEYFYQDTEILALDNVDSYTKEVDTSMYYNEVEVGFKKYSKQREIDKGNTLDDFHTKHVYQTPIQTNKNKKTILSDLIMSGYEIEILRRKQYVEDGGTNRSNFQEDDSLFGIFASTTTPFTGANYSNGSVTELDYVTILSGANDPYEANTKVTYVSTNNVSQTRTIKQTFFSGADTQIEFYEPLQGGTGVTGVEITITGTTYIKPETNESFALADFLISPETAYNLRITPKRMLQNHALLLNGGFYTKGATEEVVFKQGDGNIKLITAYQVGADCKLGDLDGYQVIEGGDIIIGDGTQDQASLQQGNSLFYPIKVTIEANLTFEQLTTIKNCLRGQGANNYGYITYPTPCGTDESIFIESIEYSPATDHSTITGYLKSI